MVFFSQGRSTSVLKVTPVQDSRNDGSNGTKTILLNLLANPSYVLGSPTNATMNLIGNHNVALPHTYTITDIGVTPRGGGPSPSGAFGVNALGKVVGWYDPTTFYYQHGFSWQNGTLTDIGLLEPNSYAYSTAFAINDSSVVVGYALYSDKDYPIKWTSGTGLTSLDLRVPGQASSYGNKAVAINSVGRIVGSCNNDNRVKQAVMWDNSTSVTPMRNLASDDPTKYSYANGVNTVGRVVGKSMIGSDNSTFHAFRTSLGYLYIQGGYDDLGTMVGGLALNSEATAINDLDEVVGGSVAANGQYHAFWKAGNTGLNDGFVDLGVLSGDNYSVAQAINMTGHIVGYSQNTSTGVQRAFVSYNNGTTVDLITMVKPPPTGWTLQVAEGINASGWIVGYGLHNGQSRAFLLTPNF